MADVRKRGLLADTGGSYWGAPVVVAGRGGARLPEGGLGERSWALTVVRR